MMDLSINMGTLSGFESVVLCIWTDLLTLHRGRMPEPCCPTLDRLVYSNVGFARVCCVFFEFVIVYMLMNIA